MPPLALLLLLGPKAAAPLSATIADVQKAPAKFDGKALVVKRKVARFKGRTSKSGRDYYTFALQDGKGGFLSVYGGDKLPKPPNDGDTVAVTGKFAAERKVGERVFKNEIDASKRLDKSFGVKG